MTDRIKFADGRPDVLVNEPVKIQIWDGGATLYTLGSRPKFPSMASRDQIGVAFYPMAIIDSVVAE